MTERVIDGLAEVKDRFVNFVFYLDQLHGAHGRFFIVGNDQSHLVTDVADDLIQDLAVIRRRFREGLTGPA